MWTAVSGVTDRHERTSRGGHILLAPDTFKGSLSAAEVADALAAGLSETAGVPVRRCPIADGGDGTVAAATSAGYERVELSATGPTGMPVRTAYARRDETAVVELADVSGLTRLPDGVLAPMRAESFGLGEVIGAALEAGCRRVVVGLGGSASTDGGAGMLTALGARLLDAGGAPIPRGGAGLARLDRIDTAGLHPALADAELIAASDVDNPLLGPRGAAAVFGPQKGAGPAQTRSLEAGLARLAEVVRGHTGRSQEARSGAGAAGGTAFALMAVLDARLRAGTEILFDVIDFAGALAGATLVVTGEGSLDEQTLGGKGPAAVARAARAEGIPTVAVAGRSLLSGEQLAAAGFGAVYELRDLEPDPARSVTEAANLLAEIGRRIGSRE
jgi:glycerate kinase